MRTFVSNSFAIFFLLLLLCGELGARTVRIQLLQTTDIHGYLEHSDELEAGGGWLRVATLIRQRRDEWGAQRTVLIDCGDTCQGTLVARLSRGSVAVDLLNALKYDVWVPGNHELDFGVERYVGLCRLAGERSLCGNVTCSVNGKTVALPAWRFLERGGARIAVIGANASYLENWLWGDAMQGYRVEPAQVVLGRIMPGLLRRRPDMIVLAIHQGWLENDPREVNEIRALVARFPEIDLILGGHTHRLRSGMKLGAKTWYVQAGMHAGHLAVVRAIIDLQAHRVLDIGSELVPADMDVAPEPAARAAAEGWLAKSSAFARKPAGTLAGAVSADGMPGEDCGTSELVCRAIAAAVGADVVFHGRLSRSGLSRGTVLEGHLSALVPYENNIAVASLTLQELREVVAEQQQFRTSYAYNGIWGAEVVVSGNGAVRSLSVPAARAPNGRILTALNSYAAAGAGGRFPRLRAIIRRPEAELRDSGIDTRDAVRKFLGNHPNLKLKTRRWIRRG